MMSGACVVPFWSVSPRAVPLRAVGEVPQRSQFVAVFVVSSFCILCLVYLKPESKVFTVVLNKRLDTWAEKEEKMSKEQVNMLKSVYIFICPGMCKTRC